MTLPYFIDFIKHALEFGKVKIKLLEMTFKGKQSILPHQQPLHCLVLTYQKSTMKPIAIQSQQEPLICILMQQGSLAVAQVVVSLLLSLLIYTICVWEAVNVSTKWHAYMLDNHWYLSIATLPDVFNSLEDAVALLITHSIINSLAIVVFSENSLFHSHT